MLLDSKYNPGDRPDTFDPLEVVSSSRSVVLRSLAAIAASAPTAIDGTGQRWKQRCEGHECRRRGGACASRVRTVR
jgi:hypothetical protein